MKWAGADGPEANALERDASTVYRGAMSRTSPKLVIVLMLALMLGGATYLYAVRGSAILLDLSAMATGLLCF